MNYALCAVMILIICVFHKDVYLIWDRYSWFYFVVSQVISLWIAQYTKKIILKLKNSCSSSFFGAMLRFFSKSTSFVFCTSFIFFKSIFQNFDTNLLLDFLLHFLVFLKLPLNSKPTNQMVKMWTMSWVFSLTFILFSLLPLCVGVLTCVCIFSLPVDIDDHQLEFDYLHNKFSKRLWGGLMLNDIITSVVFVLLLL